MTALAVLPASTAPRVRVVPVLGDHLLPALRPRRDAMIVADIDCYQGEGIYLFQFAGDDEQVPYLCDRSPTIRDRTYRLLCINEVYRRGEPQTLTEPEFLAAVRGKVIADVLEREPGVLTRLVAA